MFAPCARETHPIRAGQRLPVDPHGAERGVRGQALVPLAGPLLGHGLHEVPFQLADAGVVLEDVLVGLVEVLREGRVREEMAGGGCAGRWVSGSLPTRTMGENIGRGSMKDMIVVRGEKKRREEKKSQIVFFFNQSLRRNLI